jgi:hypothetical protein
LQEEFEDTKGVIRICKLKDRQYNGKKRQKGQTITHKSLHRKLKIEQHEPHQISGGGGTKVWYLQTLLANYVYVQRV